MRILLCPDDFKGTLTAEAAARAIAQGWTAKRPLDEVVLKPMSDGGPGFVANIAAARGVPIRTTPAMHALGKYVQAQWCLAGDTAYVEAAQVVGLSFGVDIWRATSAGMATVLLAVLDERPRRIVVGVGGTCINDGGAGMLVALGAKAFASDGSPLLVQNGAKALAEIVRFDLLEARARFAGVDLIVATDVDVPLLGPRGATYGFALQKGAIEHDLASLEAGLTALAAACGRRPDGRDPAVTLGAGAAGGLGFALLALGATRVAGFDAVWRESEIDLTQVDLVITGEGRLDWQSMRGKVVSGVARRAQAEAVPVIALAGEVTITPRERSEMGLDAAYSLTDWFGAEEALADAETSLTEAATRLTRTWGALE